MRTSKKKPAATTPPVRPAAQPAPALPAEMIAPQAAPDLRINLAPAAEARLSDAGQARSGAPAEAGLPGWQSLGKDHKPTRAHSSRQGPRERKVRW